MFNDNIIYIFDCLKSLLYSFIFLILFFLLNQKLINIDNFSKDCLDHFDFIFEKVFFVFNILFDFCKLLFDPFMKLEILIVSVCFSPWEEVLAVALINEKEQFLDLTRRPFLFKRRNTLLQFVLVGKFFEDNEFDLNLSKDEGENDVLLKLCPLKRALQARQKVESISVWLYFKLESIADV